MSSQLETISYEITNAELETLTKAGVIPAGTPPDMLKVFAVTCAQHKLSPFKKEIYLIPYQGKYSTVVGIDGMRAKASRTGLFAGRDDDKFDVQPDGTFKTAAQLAAAKQKPTTCTVTVYRMIGGQRCPFTKTVLFNEYCPAQPSNKWLSMPFNMIAKCAEAAALRMGFAEETAGLHVEEERYAITDSTVQAQANGKPTIELPADVLEKRQVVSDALADMSEFAHVLQYFTRFNESELKGNKEFARLFFQSAARTAQSREELAEFYNAASAWKKEADLINILSIRQSEIEKSAKDGK